MEKLILLILTCSMISCLSPFVDQPIFDVDPEIDRYYQTFLNEASERGYDYSGYEVVIYFGDLREGVAGMEVGRMDYIIEIVIDEQMWNEYPQMREVVLFHELGHGILKRGHVDNSMSVMATKDDNQINNFKYHRREMIDELFQN